MSNLPRVDSTRRQHIPEPPKVVSSPLDHIDMRKANNTNNFDSAADNRRRTAPGGSAAQQKFNQNSRQRHRNFLKLCGRIKPKANHNNNNNNNSMREKSSEYPTMCNPAYNKNDPQNIPAADSSNKNYFNSYADNNLVYGLGTRGIAAQEVERQLKMDRDPMAAHESSTTTSVKSTATSKKGNTVFDRLVKGRAEKVLTIKEQQQLLKQQQKEQEERYDDFCKTQPTLHDGDNKASKGKKSVKLPPVNGSPTQVPCAEMGSPTLSNMAHDGGTSASPKMKRRPFHLYSTDFSEAERGVGAPMQQQSSAAEEGDGGGIMDAFGYFSTHRVHPHYYRKMRAEQLQQQQAKVPVYRRNH